MHMTSQSDYQSLLEQEGAVWGSAARDFAAQVAPDWQIMQRRPPHNVLYRRQINALLDTIRPGMRVLEIGCWSGWLSLEMARRGAHVTGIDVAADALHIAREYAAAHPPTGTLEYRLLDINQAALEPDTYDLIVGIGVVHHLVEVERVLDQLHRALKPGGRLFVCDVFEGTPRPNALICGGLLMLLPTQLSYRDKFRHLLRLRRDSLAHITDSIEAKGLSPFEGYGRHQKPEDLIPQRFTLRSMHTDNAFTGYIVQQLKLPLTATSAIGRALSVIDTALIRLRLLRGLNYTLTAEK